MKKNALSLLLLVSLAAGTVSCGGTPVSDETTAAPDSTVPEETTENLYLDLGSHDFGGKTFTIAYCSTQLGSMWPYETAEENGDLVNDAVFQRDRSIEERYNVDIAYYDTSSAFGENVAKCLMTSVMAGDKAYDLGIGHMFTGVNALVEQHGLYDFNSLPYVDYSKPWWSQHLRDQLEVGGKLLLHSGDIVYNFCDCIYFNKDMMKDFAIADDPYELVESGKWTWDRLIAMAKTVEGDVDGNGVWDENDRYGYLMSINTYVDSNWVYAAGLTIASHKDGGVSTENVMTDRMQTLAETMYKLVHGDHTTYIPATTGKESIEDAKLFRAGQGLFMENITTLLPQMRDFELDFGILPIPKLDEKQKDYMTMATTQMMMLPATIDDAEFVGLMLEALAEESHKIVNPAVYETSFSGKYLRDERSYEMYSIIRTSGVYDFNWNYGAGNVFAQLMTKVVRQGEPSSLASFYASNRDSVQAKLDSIYDILLHYDD